MIGDWRVSERNSGAAGVWETFLAVSARSGSGGCGFSVRSSMLCGLTFLTSYSVAEFFDRTGNSIVPLTSLQSSRLHRTNVVVPVVVERVGNLARAKHAHQIMGGIADGPIGRESDVLKYSFGTNTV